jgi:bacterioferritin (cytochrome b1)
MFTHNLVELLNSDIKNEYKHMHFYLHYASLFTGPHHDSMRDLFLKQASSEMQHVHQFSKLIVGLDGMPTCLGNEFNTNLRDTKSIIFNAIEMEEEVVQNYVQRCEDAASLQKNLSHGTLSVAAKYVQLFLEEQIQDSQSDIDHLKQIFKGL